MTAVKTHSMALKDGDGTKVEIEAVNPASSTPAWVCHLTFLKGGQSLAVHLSNDEAVKLGAALFQIVAERGGQKWANDRPSVSLGIMVMAWQHYFDKFHGTRRQMKEGALRFCEAERR